MPKLAQTTLCSSPLEDVVAEVDTSATYSVDPETGRATDFIDYSGGDIEGVGLLNTEGWNYYCYECGMVTNSWKEIKEAHTEA